MARSINGTSENIDLGSVNFNFTPGTGQVKGTVSLWANSATVTGLEQAFIQISGSPNVLFGIFFVNAVIRGQSLGPNLDSSIAAAANTWYNVVFSVSDDASQNGFISVNGTVNTGTGILVTTAGGPVASHAMIGDDPVNTPRIFNGRVADLAVWNVDLTQAEALALNRGARPWQIRRQNLQAWLPIDGNASPEVDLSGNKFNGTLTGTAKVPGPPFTMFTPRHSQFLAGVAAAPATVQRRTLDNLGTRAGSRHIRAA